MGVLNVTPDSFSDGGQFVHAAAAVQHGLELVAQGATFIDVGGESTRPGATPVAREEELRRVLPVIEGLTAEGVAVSIDTLHAETAEAAFAAGARWINDVSGGLHDPRMLETAGRLTAEYNGHYILGHWRGIPDAAQRRSEYSDVVSDVRDALLERVRAARAAGLELRRITLDPGLGFDKTGGQCWQLLSRIDELQALGFNVLIGASRKRMLAELLEQLPTGAGADPGAGTAAHDRDLATSVVSAFAAQAGVWGVRVHDVRGTAQALLVQQAWQAGRLGAPAASDARSAAPTDRITLTGLEVFAHHGVFDFEREQGQRFIIDAEVSVDLRAAAAGDALAQTVHYGELAEAIVAAVERDPVDLIETVAERVAAIALGFGGVRETTITVHKPDAPIDATFADVAVTVVRSAPCRAAAQHNEGAPR